MRAKMKAKIKALIEEGKTDEEITKILSDDIMSEGEELNVPISEDEMAELDELKKNTKIAKSEKAMEMIKQLMKDINLKIGDLASDIYSEELYEGTSPEVEVEIKKIIKEIL